MKGRNGTIFAFKKKRWVSKRNIQAMFNKGTNKKIYDKIEIGEMVKLRKLDWQDVPSSPKQATFTNDVN